MSDLRDLVAVAHAVVQACDHCDVGRDACAPECPMIAASVLSEPLLGVES